MLKRLFLPLTLLAAAATSHAQRVDVSAGAGMNNLGTSGAHLSVLAAATAKLLPGLALGGEYAYQNTSPSQTVLDLGPPLYTVINIEAKEHLQNYGGVIHGLFPHRHSAQSYLLAAGGGLRVTDNSTVTVTSYPPLNTVVGTSAPSRNGYYFGAGGGVSIPLGKGFGLRPEFRYERQHLPSYTVNSYTVPSSHANQILFSMSLYRGFGSR